MIEKIIVKKVLSKENAAKLKTKFLTEKQNYIDGQLELANKDMKLFYKPSENI